MVRMGDYPRSLRTLVYICHHIQQTRLHCHVVYVVDCQLYQHDEMEKE